jgi:putative sterol carrier protein
VPEFLSADWVTALDRVAQSVPSTNVDRTLVIEHRMIGPPGAVATHHLVVDLTGIRVVAGAATEPDVVITTDAGTARALASGATNAQQALAAGTLHVDGDIDALARNTDALARLGDLFAPARQAQESDDRNGR